MLTGLIFGAALLATSLPQPSPNDLSTLPSDQRTVARCMFSSVQANPRVANARLQVSLKEGVGDGAVSTREVLLDYDYIQVIPELKRQEKTTEVNLTPYLTAKSYAAMPVIIWNGIAPKPTPPGYFSDSHHGLMEIMAAWGTGCLANFEKYRQTTGSR